MISNEVEFLRQLLKDEEDMCETIPFPILKIEESAYKEHQRKIIKLKQCIRKLAIYEQTTDIINKVAHVGIDFGYGEYILEQETILTARKISESLPNTNTTISITREEAELMFPKLPERDND